MYRNIKNCLSGSIYHEKVEASHPSSTGLAVKLTLLTLSVTC